jgi:uncharacterized protein YciI
MRKIFLLTLLASCLIAPTASAAEPSATYGKANPGPISAYVMLIRLRWDLYARFKDTGKWPDDKAANEVLTAHSQYWDQQLKAGRALLAGGMKGDQWDNVALIIFEASSPEEAKALVANDPAVKAYVFQAEVRPFDVHFLTNKFQTPRRDEKPQSP